LNLEVRRASVVSRLPSTDFDLEFRMKVRSSTDGLADASPTTIRGTA
jgi:hypothetical protein